MNYLDTCLDKIYSSEDYSQKGYDLEPIESFLYVFNNEVFVVFIFELSDFGNNWQKYEYAIWSISTSEYIKKNDDRYSELVSMMPALVDLKPEGGTEDIFKTMELSDTFNNLVASVSGEGAISDDIAKEYLSYMKEAISLKSPSVQKIYGFFKDSFVSK